MIPLSIESVPTATASPETRGDVGERVLFVFARPLDETLLAGGTMAMLAASGAHVTLLTATDGGIADDGELASAMRALGVTDHRMLGARDARADDAPPRTYGAAGSAMTDDAGSAVTDAASAGSDAVGSPAGDGTAGTLLEAEPGEVAADIATVIASTQAGAVVAYGDDGVDGHPDRLAVHAAARHAAEVMDVPFYTAGVGARGRGFSVDVAAAFQAKRAALVAYGARPTETGVQWPDGESQELEPREAFGRRDAAPAREWSDLGLPARVVAVVVALIVGAAIGGLGTVVYQAGFAIGDVPVPAGIVGGLAVIAALLSGLRIVLRTRIVATAAAAGMLGIIALLSLESAGGSVLVPAAPLSYYWLYGPVVIALVVLAWPDLTVGNGRRDRVRIDEDQRPAGGIDTP